ncbi:MAG: hypothetical protein JJ964_09310 [Rhizobiales bacterium]|nr:hypothetical protein [Hyphomicrobiales bacterium]
MTWRSDSVARRVTPHSAVALGPVSGGKPEGSLKMATEAQLKNTGPSEARNSP